METNPNLRAVDARAAAVKIPTDFEKQVASGEAVIVDLSQLSLSDGTHESTTQNEQLFRQLEEYCHERKICYYIEQNSYGEGSKVIPLTLSTYDGGVDISMVYIDEFICIRRNYDSDQEYQVRIQTTYEYLFELTTDDILTAIIPNRPSHASRRYYETNSIAYQSWVSLVNRVIQLQNGPLILVNHEQYSDNNKIGQSISNVSVAQYNDTGIRVYFTYVKPYSHDVYNVLMTVQTSKDSGTTGKPYVSISAYFVPSTNAGENTLIPLFDLNHISGTYLEAAQGTIDDIISMANNSTNYNNGACKGQIYDDSELAPLAFYGPDNTMSCLSSDGSIYSYELFGTQAGEYKVHRFNTKPTVSASTIASGKVQHWSNISGLYYVAAINSYGKILIDVDETASFQFCFINTDGSLPITNVIFINHWIKKLNNVWTMCYQFSADIGGRHYDTGIRTANYSNDTISIDRDGIRYTY